MTSLLTLFQQRDEEYKKVTKEILTILLPLIEAVMELVDDETAKYLQWKAVELIDTYVMLVGVVDFPVGHKIILETGTVITVTEENKEEARRSIRVGVPIEIVVTSNKDELIKYLQTFSSFKKPHVETTEEINTTDLTQNKINEIMWHLENTSKGIIN